MLMVLQASLPEPQWKRHQTSAEVTRQLAKIR